MSIKIFVVAVVLAVAMARPQEEYEVELKHEHELEDGHGYGHRHEHKHERKHAYSFQSVKRHDIPGKAPEGHFDYYSYPKYEFEYKVEDPHTGDKKSHLESRDGDVVKGYYRMHEADGTIRTVEYSSDKKTGFYADVKHEGHAEHIEPRHHD